MKELLLENEKAFVFQNKLVEIFGLAESIVLQQIHYWLNRSENIVENAPWVYNSYENWHKQLSFLSKSSIIRAIKKLETIGVLKSNNFNRLKFDKTKWYTIDYEKLQMLCGNEVTICSKRVKEESTEDKPIPDNTPENTPIKKKRKKRIIKNKVV